MALCVSRQAVGNAPHPKRERPAAPAVTPVIVARPTPGRAPAVTAPVR